MKIRNGFVSNSSSSSFVCDACGEVAVGYDGEYDFKVKYCVKNHSFCADHMDNSELTTQDKLRMMLNDKDFMYEVEDLCENDMALFKAGNDELVNELFDCEYQYFHCEKEVSEAMCPVCNLACVSSDNILLYLLKKSGQTMAEVEAEIQNKFNNLTELQES